jgi:hypothetical protein
MHDNPALAQSIDDKLDPWLVSFSPDDPENPMVRCACWPVFSAFDVFNISPSFADLAPVETLVHHNCWRRPSFEFVRTAYPILRIYIRLLDLPSEHFLVLLRRTCFQK